MRYWDFGVGGVGLSILLPSWGILSRFAGTYSMGRLPLGSLSPGGLFASAWYGTNAGPTGREGGSAFDLRGPDVDGKSHYGRERWFGCKQPMERDHAVQTLNMMDRREQHVPRNWAEGGSPVAR